MTLVLVITICLYNLMDIYYNHRNEKELKELIKSTPGLEMSCIKGKHLLLMVPIKSWCSSNGEIMDHSGKQILTDGKYCDPKCPQKYGDECIHFRKEGYPSLPLQIEENKHLRCQECKECNMLKEVSIK